MIVAGFGCRAGATPTSLHAALTAAMRGHPRPDALATLRDKEPQLAPLAQSMALPLLLLDATALEQQATLTRSPASLAAHRTGSLAEAAALAAVGRGARLLSPRHISPDRLATCALAEGTSA